MNKNDVKKTQKKWMNENVISDKKKIYKHVISIKWGSNEKKNKHIEAGLKIHYAYEKKGVVVKSPDLKTLGWGFKSALGALGESVWKLFLGSTQAMWGHLSRWYIDNHRVLQEVV